MVPSKAALSLFTLRCKMAYSSPWNLLKSGMLVQLQFSHGTNWKKRSACPVDPETGFAESPRCAGVNRAGAPKLPLQTVRN